MEARLLGWAGVQLRDGHATLVIDPLLDPTAVWAPFGAAARHVPYPEGVPATPAGASGVGLVTHLHLDHADAGALASALAPDGVVLVPEPVGGDALEEGAVVTAQAALTSAGLRVEHVSAWECREIDGWTITALPAADGLGDPQVSWLVERGNGAVVHCGDTLMHGWWWRTARRAGRPIGSAFLPVNGARVRFPHRVPASPHRAMMNAADAAVAGAALGAAAIVPIHYGGYDFPGVYEPDPDPLADLRDAAAGGPEVRVPALGAWFEA